MGSVKNELCKCVSVGGEAWKIGSSLSLGCSLELIERCSFELHYVDCRATEADDERG